MTELLTAAQMRAIEQAAIESGEVTGLELMERAGRGVVEAIFEEWPKLAQTSHRAVVLCGPGNNGGDGFVVARLLKEWGWEVEVFLYGDPEKLPPDARVNYERWCEAGQVNSTEALDFGGFGHPDLFVDALFGTGLTRPMDAAAEFLFTIVQELRPAPLVVSVDIRSGFSSDTGTWLGPKSDFGFLTVLGADLAVTFQWPKVGHFLGDLSQNSSSQTKLKTVDIGLSVNGLFLKQASHVALLNGLLSDLYLRKDSFFGSHKYDYGHALILSGGLGKTGAARLTARSALRIGAGLVTVACPPEALAECAAHLTAVMVKPVADAGVLATVLEDERLNALCLGPGLGVGEDARALVEVAIKTDRAAVLDADALTSFEDDPDTLFALCRDRRVVMTPHAGEFARLFPDIAKTLGAEPMSGPGYSKVDATREAAARSGAVVLFKGPDTVIAAPDGRCAINSAHYDREAPWLATAGSGDVLAGFITGLLARGLDTMQAAETAAWLHVECALSFGPGLIAEDLPEELPKVFRKLGL